MATETKKDVMEITPIDGKRKTEMHKFAFCGTNEFFNNKLQYLSEIAETEEWTSTYAESNGRKNDRLFNYIIKTFERCLSQKLIIESNDQKSCIFNTGLLTEFGEDIYCYFEENTNPPKGEFEPQKWKFINFVKASSRCITDNYNARPKLAQYCDNYEDFYFNAEKNVDINITHIIDDHWDEEDNRFPEKLKSLGKKMVVALINYAADIALVRIKRNHRLVVPQFYNNEIMYLIPLEIHINESESVTMALAVEKTATGDYRANTIFNLDMAYTKARLVMKPESNWLIK